VRRLTVDGEGGAGAIPRHTAVLTEAQAGRLSERHPTCVGQAAVVPRHFQAVPVVERYPKDRLDAALPDVAHAGVTDLAGGFVTHPELHP
jgi:hypothetical protein